MGELGRTREKGKERLHGRYYFLHLRIVIGQNSLNVNLRLNTFFQLVEINMTPFE